MASSANTLFVFINEMCTCWRSQVFLVQVWIVLSLFSFILVSLEIETCHSEVISPCFLSSIVYFCNGLVAEGLQFRFVKHLPQKSLSAQLPLLNNGIGLKIC